MRQRLFIAGLVSTVLELGFDALLLFAFFGLTREEAVAGGVSLVPALALSTLFWVYFQSRWLRGVDGEKGDEEAREAVVRFTRRSLLYRTMAVAGLGLLLAPTLAGIVGVELSAAGVIAGSITVIGFVTNLLRSFLFRRALDPRGQELYAQEPLRYYARCLRERLFVSTNLVGAVGVAASSLFVRYVMGIPAAEFTAVVALAPVVLAVTVPILAWDTWRATNPLLPFLVPSRHQGAKASPAQALAISSSAPYRTAGVCMLFWLAGSTVTSLIFQRMGGLPVQTLQMFAGITAAGIGILPFQVTWQRRVLLRAREAAALSVVASEQAPPRSRLSLRVKLVVAFVVLVAFGGTFAFLSAFAEHDRYVAAAATADAVARRDVVLSTYADAIWAASGDEAKLAALARRLSVAGEQVVLVRDGKIIGREELELPRALASHLGGPGHGPLPRLESSLAFAPVAPGLSLGVLKKWKSPLEREGLVPLLFVYAALGFAVAGLVLVAVQELTAPLRALARGAERIGRGDLKSPIPPPDADELAELANAMEYARRELAAKIRRVEELNLSLEQRVADRTAALETANKDLASTLQALEAARADVVHAEKMASLGRLVAGIAHEINNPLNFVQNALPPLKNALQSFARLASGGGSPDTAALSRELADVEDLLRVMGNGVTRMDAIVRALRDFSRQSEEGAREPFELEQVIDDAAALLRHELKDRVQLVKELASRSRIVGQPGPITQVFMNLFKNAAQAIDGHGTIRVVSREVEGGVEIRVADDGRGIPPESLPKIFEPFFTTKPVGEGTGLGLAIVHGIVEKHGGHISVSSPGGRGTEFAIFLPQEKG